MGRRIKARGKTSISFLPHRQVLADQMVFHTEDGSSLLNVQVKCQSSNNTETNRGYIDIASGEAITVGWNCGLSHQSIEVPQTARSLIQSFTDDDQESRMKRGSKAFTIQAKNSMGHSIIGFANDRLMGYTNTRPRAGWKWAGRNWPTILVATAASTLLMFCTISCIRNKILQKTGWPLSLIHI